MDQVSLTKSGFSRLDRRRDEVGFFREDRLVLLQQYLPRRVEHLERHGDPRSTPSSGLGSMHGSC